MSELNRDAWLAALRAIDEAPLPNDPDAVTVAEFSELIGRSRCQASKKLQRLVKAGKAICCQKRIRREHDGVIQPIAAYKLVEEVPDAAVRPTPRVVGGRDRSQHSKSGRRARRHRTSPRKTR